jgi:hypothetical protein
MTAPSKLGRYEIVRPIGKSMTDVYLAIDTVENRKAALKLIRPDGGSDSRLVMEAERRGAAIQKELGGLDPRMVQIYDFGDLDGYFFVAMQYVEGRTLAEVLEGASVIGANRAAVIALEICEQLAKFHSMPPAVVHGDIKPSNIHLGPNDTVRLLDFGIAKTLRANGDATAHQFGSLGYCAPERLARSEVDEQSDLWALAATLYEMLTGAPPYRAQDTHKLENLIRSKRPPRALPASCPSGLGAIVMKALAPDPARRYASAQHVQADLQAFLEHRPTVAELERRMAWSASATLVAAREVLRKATRTLVRARRTLRLAGALGWFLVGMALSIGGIQALRTWQAHQAAGRTAAARAAAKTAAAVSVNAPPALREQPGLYTAEAGAVIDSYRQSADPSLDDFDWYKAEIYLERAAALGDASRRTEGELALAKGYATLERLAAGSYSPTAAALLRSQAHADFASAMEKMPDQADPHLAMARLYVYAEPDVAKAIEEFAAAERLGARLGRREIEQQGDAYRMRAEREAGGQPWHAWNDAQKAKALYQSIPGFDQADADLRQVARIRYGRAGRRPASRGRLWR